HRMDPPADATREPMPDKIVPMMARLGPLPPDDERWAFEIKWDGVRAIAHSEPGRLHFHSRNLHDLTPRYPELARLNRALSHPRALHPAPPPQPRPHPPPRDPRRRGRRPRRGGPAELRGAPAADAPHRRERG